MTLRTSTQKLFPLLTFCGLCLCMCLRQWLGVYVYGKALLFLKVNCGSCYIKQWYLFIHPILYCTYLGELGARGNAILKRQIPYCFE